MELDQYMNTIDIPSLKMRLSRWHRQIRFIAGIPESNRKEQMNSC